ncbi:MAG: transporter substrate-binding domain-containing protein [Acaryochloridaceae cyanobacterium CSU_3_4]|nr:transporter substrate-binding domain-containing protein [Acaryochloridaceae cyanobacterium CSU_3_4]
MVTHHRRWFYLGLLVVWFYGLVGVTATAQAAELAEIRRRGHLIVAVKDNLRPLGFRDGSGQLQGLEIDIARGLALDILGDAQAVIFKPVFNQDRLALVTSGEVDVAIANLTATDNRRRLVHFSRPYWMSSTTLLTFSPQIRGLQDLNQKRIAVLQGSRAIAIVRYALPSAILVGVDSYQQARSLLTEKEIDAFAGDHAVLIGWVQQVPTAHPLPQPLARHPLAIAMPKGLRYVPLHQHIDASLSRWQAQGWLKARIQHWGLASPS